MCQYLETITDWDGIDSYDCGHPDKDGICEDCEFGIEEAYEALQAENARIVELQTQFDAENKDANGKLKKMFAC